VLEGTGGGYSVWIWRNEPEDYSDAYFEKAAFFTEQTALLLKLSLNEELNQKQNTKLAALLELSTAIYSSLNYTDVLEKAIHLAMKIVGAEGGSIFILDKDKVCRGCRDKTRCDDCAFNN